MTVPITKLFDGIPWEGNIEIFSLRNHKAKRCYAWGGIGDENNRELTLILELPPVGSPNTAVQMAIARKMEKQPLAPENQIRAAPRRTG